MYRNSVINVGEIKSNHSDLAYTPELDRDYSETELLPLFGIGKIFLELRVLTFICLHHQRLYCIEYNRDKGERFYF